MFYRVTVECTVIVEAESVEEAEDKVLDAPGVGHQAPIVLDLTVPCDEDGNEIEEDGSK